MLLPRDAFNTEIPAHQVLQDADAFTRRRFWQKELLDPGTFTHRCLYTEMLLHTVVLTHTHTHILLRSAVTCKFFCAEILLHARIFTQTYLDIH